jgi:hypothetical protein
MVHLNSKPIAAVPRVGYQDADHDGWHADFQVKVLRPVAKTP